MSIYDTQTKPDQFIKTEPSVGGIQHYRKLTAGAGAQKFEVSLEAGGLIMGGEIASAAPVWIGFDGKFIFGNKAGGKYIEWDLSTLAIRGTLNADDITAGTISGRTVKATGGSASDVWLDSSDGTLKFYYNSVQGGTVSSDGGGGMVYATTTNHYFRKGGNELGRLTSNGFELPGSTRYYCASSAGTDFNNVMWLTSIRVDEGALQAKGRSLTVVGGIVTNLSVESDWWHVHTF